MDTHADYERIAYQEDIKLGIDNPGLKCEEAYECKQCDTWHCESDSLYWPHHHTPDPVADIFVDKIIEIFKVIYKDGARK